MVTYSSLLLIISQVRRIKQCWQTAMKMPDSQKTENMHFQYSGPALRHRSTQLIGLGKLGSEGSSSQLSCELLYFMPETRFNHWIGTHGLWVDLVLKIVDTVRINPIIWLWMSSSIQAWGYTINRWIPSFQTIVAINGYQPLKIKGRLIF